MYDKYNLVYSITSTESVNLSHYFCSQYLSDMQQNNPTVASTCAARQLYFIYIVVVLVVVAVIVPHLIIEPQSPDKFTIISYLADADKVVLQLSNAAKAKGMSIEWSMIGEDRGISKKQAYEYTAERFRNFITLELSEDQYKQIFESNTGSTWIFYKESNPESFLLSLLPVKDNSEVFDVKVGIFKEVEDNTLKKKGNSHAIASSLNM